MPPSHIAVLGGGLSGISSAFHLSRRFPTSSITLLEKSNRLGGWVKSERVEVQDAHGNAARILVESGPRTLRPKGKAVLELINLLSLQSTFLPISKSHPAARNRFLHIPGTSGLTIIPQSFSTLLQSPLTRILIPSLIGGIFKSHSPAFKKAMKALEATEDGREALGMDIDVDTFIKAKFGEDFARLFASALIHGIYAADSRLLSVRASFPSLWNASKCRGSHGHAQRGWGYGYEASPKGSEGLPDYGDGHYARRPPPPLFHPHHHHRRWGWGSWGHDIGEDVYDLGGIKGLVKGASVYSFTEGMETIVRALEAALVKNPKVELNTSTGKQVHATHLVSAMPLRKLQDVLSASPTVPHLPNLTANPTSSVTVVNVIFPPTPQPIHPPGFGYLVPRAREDPVTGKPIASELEDQGGVLGTVFDDTTLSEQDIYLSVDGQKTPLPLGLLPPPQNRFTKVTMMLGGPHALPSPLTQTHILETLQRHLDPPFTLPFPVYMKMNKLDGCIPTYTVGHLKRMEEMKDVLSLREEEGGWGGRLDVLGASVGGVSVPECVEQGRRAGAFW